MSTATSTRSLTPHRSLLFVGKLALAAVAAISIAGCSQGDLGTTPTAADSAGPTLSTTASSLASATATAGSGRGSGFFGGSAPEVPVSFARPDGWEAEGPFVSKSDADPVFGLVFMDVGNIYADGCNWELVDPQPGTTVDDLVAAYAKIPGYGGVARNVTVSGFSGKQIEFTVPDYDKEQCTNGQFGIFQEDGSSGTAPSLWAQAPQQQNRLWILDVGGTRLVILAGDPGNMSAQDRTDLERIISSIRIG